MLFHITQVHTPETCPRDEGGSNSLFDPNTPGVKLIGRYGANSEHILFYIVEAGQVEVTTAGGRVTDLGPGDYFGEIALLRDVPRSATCTAKTNVELYTIDRERFVSAVTGNLTSASEIESVIHRRLGGLEAVA